MLALIDNKIHDITKLFTEIGGNSNYIFIFDLEKSNIFFLYSVCDHTEFILQT